MKTAIIIYQFFTPKFDLNILKKEKDNFQFVLFAMPDNIKKFSKTNLDFFDEKHIFDSFDYDQLEKVARVYLKENNNENLYIITSDESAMLMTSELCEHLNLQGPKPQQILPFLDKVMMKDLLKKSNIRVPQYTKWDWQSYKKNPQEYLEKIHKNLLYPVIAKPVLYYGSYGTVKINDENELSNWALKEKSSDLEYELEEFIEGTLFHCDTLVKNKRALYFLTSQYNIPCMFFGESRRNMASKANGTLSRSR